MDPAVHRDFRTGELSTSTPLNRSSPQEGDVVVTREARLRVHYTVRQVPGMVQFSAAVRDQALQLARRFAQDHAVDVWYSEAGRYRLLEAYRPRTSPRSRDRQTDDVSTD